MTPDTFMNFDYTLIDLTRKKGPCFISGLTLNLSVSSFDTCKSGKTGLSGEGVGESCLCCRVGEDKGQKEKIVMSAEDDK